MTIIEPRPIPCRDKALARLATSRSSTVASHRKPSPRSRIPPSREGSSMKILLNNRRRKPTRPPFGGEKFRGDLATPDLVPRDHRRSPIRYRDHEDGNFQGQERCGVELDINC